MKNRIYFFANFGDWKKLPHGGGEVGNRRTLALMKKMGFELNVIEKYNRVNNHSTLNLILLFCKMVGSVLKFASRIIFGRRQCSLVHIVGFYGPMTYYENTLVSIAKACGYKVIYEMRGGGADTYYDEGSFLYRTVFRSMLKKSDIIFSQGKENYPLIERLSQGKPVYYYPNFVMDDFCPKEYPKKSTERVNIMYFGRVSKTKNVEVAVDAFVKVATNYKNVYLDIVGNTPEPEYAEIIRQRIADSGYADRVQMHPACNHEQLKEHLKDKHIYLFPTSEPHEGHSNAMTEAMAWGLIPIATAQGFNRSVVNNDTLIVESLTANAFAASIERLIQSGKMEDYSRSAYQRVIDNYSMDMVYRSLKAEYDCLFKLWFNS